jgi:hypothetical protein
MLRDTLREVNNIIRFLCLQLDYPQVIEYRLKKQSMPVKIAVCFISEEAKHVWCEQKTSGIHFTSFIPTRFAVLLWRLLDLNLGHSFIDFICESQQIMSDFASKNG